MKRRTCALLIISIFTSIILGLILFQGIYSIFSLKKEEGSLRGEMEAWVKKGKQTSSLQNTLVQAKKVRELINKYFFDPTEENQILLISDIEKIVRDTGSSGEVKSFDLLNDKSKIIGSVLITGEWSNVYHTILALEAYPIKLNLDDVSILEDRVIPGDEKNKISQKIIYRANIRFTITNIAKSEQE